MTSFTLAIVGRPNVGKSTLFNRLAGKKLALVDDTPGLTRDWREAEGHLFGQSFRIIDTAGLEERFDDSIPARMRRQTESARARRMMNRLRCRQRNRHRRLSDSCIWGSGI